MGSRHVSTETAPATGRLALGFAALTALTYGLIVLGALVRANGAGLACPDWPLCFGQVVPRFDLRIAFEVGHRYLAASVGLAFLALSVAVLRTPGLGRALAPLLGLSAALLALQVLLGALTVWELLASWTVTSHLVTGNAFAASLLLVAMRLREAGGRPARAAPPGAVRWAVGVSSALLALQMVLGGLVASRFVGLACPEWPTCLGGAWLPGFQGAVGLHLLHRFTGYALVLSLVAGAVAARGLPRLGPLLVLAAGLGCLQVGVGVANVLLRIPVEVTGLHSALAAGLVAVATLCLRELWLQRERAPSGAATPAAL